MEKNYYAWECSKKEKEQLHTTLSAESESDSNKIKHIFMNISGALSTTQLLLDNQSTVDQFVNPKYLTNIHLANRSTEVFWNAGSTSTNQCSTFGSIITSSNSS